MNLNWEEIAKKAGIYVPQYQNPNKKFVRRPAWRAWHMFVACIPLLYILKINTYQKNRYGELYHEIQRVHTAYLNGLVRADPEIVDHYLYRKGSILFNNLIQRSFRGHRLRISKYKLLNNDYHNFKDVEYEMDQILNKKK